ncbi:hypothetical protein Tco_0246996 [Tanacetum coccineum]
MTEPSGGGLDDRDEREGTPPPLTKEQIEGHISAMKSIIKDYNRQNKADSDPYGLGTVTIPQKVRDVSRRKNVGSRTIASTSRKTPQKTPLTRRIIEFAGPEYVMPTNITLYDGSTDPADHLNRFLMAANSGEWTMPVWCRMFQQTLDGGARGWFESLPLNSINECSSSSWIHKSSEKLAKRFSSNIPKTIDEMMRRVDEFVRAEEANALMKLPPGESRDIHRRLSFPTGP